jgi:hypothetical protein
MKQPSKHPIQHPRLPHLPPSIARNGQRSPYPTHLHRGQHPARTVCPSQTRAPPPTSTYITRRARHRACLRFLSPSLRSSPRARRPSRTQPTEWGLTQPTRRRAERVALLRRLRALPAVVGRGVRRAHTADAAAWRRRGGDEKGKGWAQVVLDDPQVEFSISFPLCSWCEDVCGCRCDSEVEEGRC